MYRPGDLAMDLEEGIIDSSDNFDTIKGVYLPHACDEWVIGGPEQIKALIADLQAALKKIDLAGIVSFRIPRKIG